MGAAGAIQIGLLIGGTIIKEEEAQTKAEFETAQLERIRQEQRAQANQQALRQDEQVRTVLGEQVAHEAAAGLAPGSLAPIEEDTFNKFAEDRNALNLNLKYHEQALDLEEGQINKEKNWALIGNLFDLGQGMYKAKQLSDLTGALQAPSTGQTKTSTQSTGLTDIDKFNRGFLLGQKAPRYKREL